MWNGFYLVCHLHWKGYFIRITILGEYAKDDLWSKNEGQNHVRVQKKFRMATMKENRDVYNMVGCVCRRLEVLVWRIGTERRELDNDLEAE